MVARNPRKKVVEEVVTEAPTEAVKTRVKATKGVQAVVKDDRYHLRSAQLQVLISQRHIKSACIVNNRYDESAPYIIDLDLDGGDTVTLLHSKEDKVRTFASLDKAVKAIHDLGIKGQITVCVSAQYD
jgi:hypothetical protein